MDDGRKYREVPTANYANYNETCGELGLLDGASILFPVANLGYSWLFLV